MDIEVIFSGIGTEVISLAIGAVVGGFTGYKIGVKKKFKQSQKAGAGAKQSQKINDDMVGGSSNVSKVSTKTIQTQKAGKNAEQSQVGSFKDGRK